MARRSFLTDLPPADAESYKDIRWVTYSYSATGRVGVKLWVGRARKPTAHYYFDNAEKAAAFIRKEKGSADSRETHKSARKGRRAADIAKMVEIINVGTLLHCSWGYEQTNCDFYQVTEKKGCTITMREIGSRTVPGSQGDYNGMADRRMPARDKFIGPPMRKTIGEGGIRMSHGYATPTGDNEAHYCSWYA